MEVNGERRGVRGRDRAVADEAWMRRRLEPAPVGVLSMVDGHRPVANVNLFALDRGGRVIYLHTSTRRICGRAGTTGTSPPRNCVVPLLCAWTSTRGTAGRSGSTMITREATL